MRWTLPFLLALACRADAGPRAGIAVAIARPASSEANELVVELIEQAAAGVPGVLALDGEADERGARLVIWFADPQEVERALPRLRDALTAAQRSLPAEADPPLVTRLAAPGQIGYTLIDETAPLLQLAAVEREVVRANLLMVPGVGGIATCGDLRPETQVILEADRLAAYGVTVVDVVQALRQARDPRAATLPRGRLADVAQIQESAAPGDCRAFVVLGEKAQPAVSSTVEAKGTAVSAALEKAAQSLPPSAALRVRGAGVELAAELPSGASLEQRIELALRAARTLSQAGRVIVEVPREGEIRLHVEGAAPRLPELPGVKLRRSGEARWIAITGPDRAALERAAEALAAGLAQLDGTTGVGTRGAARGWRESRVVDRARAAELGVPLADVALTVSVLEESGAPVAPGLRVRLLVPSLGLRVRAGSGQLIPLEALVRVEQSQSGPLLRRDRERAVLLWVSSTRPKQIDEWLAKAPLAAGIRARVVPAP